MFEFLCITVLLIGLIGVLIDYARGTKDALKDVGIINLWTVSLAVLVFISFIVEMLKRSP